MGGPGTGSLLSAIAGAGASTAGALTRRPGAGQPLVALSQNLADQDMQQQRLAQDQKQQEQNAAANLQRQLSTEANRAFYQNQASQTLQLSKENSANLQKWREHGIKLADTVEKDRLERITMDRKRLGIAEGKDAREIAKINKASNPYMDLIQGITDNKVKPETFRKDAQAIYPNLKPDSPFFDSAEYQFLDKKGTLSHLFGNKDTFKVQPTPKATPQQQSVAPQLQAAPVTPTYEYSATGLKRTN